MHVFLFTGLVCKFMLCVLGAHKFDSFLVHVSVAQGLSPLESDVGACLRDSGRIVSLKPDEVLPPPSPENIKLANTLQ